MQSIFSVGQINTYIKNMFTQDFVLNRVAISAEVSNCKYHTSGHIYFSLKDETGSIACVMFAGQRRGLAFVMKDGQRVVVQGSVNVYERDGRYQVYAKEIQLEGKGLLFERFEALKRELEEMGMFAKEYKQPIPRYIKRLGIVTAPTGAAIRDIMNIAYRRNPYIQLILYPALVQGAGAAASIAAGIQRLDKMDVDTIIVGRGGGSIEDLWGFNEEVVARAVFDCKTPVISAVGHETDTTIADYVADLRAPTPSAAAELAVDDLRAVLDRFEEYKHRLRRSLESKVILYCSRLERYQMKINYLSPENQIREKRQFLVDKGDKLEQLMKQKLQERRHRFIIYVTKMNAMSPLTKLQQGYSYVADQSGRSITSIEQVNKDDTLNIQVTNGKLQVMVTDKISIERI